MFVRMYKAGGHHAAGTNEKIIKIVATIDEVKAFKQGVEAIIGDSKSLQYIKELLLEGWKINDPYTDYEKETYKGKRTYILKLYERHLEEVIFIWAELMKMHLWEELRPTFKLRKPVTDQ